MLYRQPVEGNTRNNGWGVTNRNAITTEDLNRYKAIWSRAGRLTAALNYYRTAIRENSIWPSSVLEKTRTSQLSMPVLLLYGSKDAAFLPSTF
jgi:hypothetical protein